MVLVNTNNNAEKVFSDLSGLLRPLVARIIDHFILHLFASEIVSISECLLTRLKLPFLQSATTVYIISVFILLFLFHFLWFIFVDFFINC